MRNDERISHCWVLTWKGTTHSSLLPMALITEVFDWLSSLKLLRLNTWARIEPMGQVWSTGIQVVAASWCIQGKYKYTSIIQWREIKYRELTFLHLFILQVVSATGADSTGVYENLPTEAPQVSTFVQVSTAATLVTANIFTGTLQCILGFTNIQVRGLVDVGCDSQ